MTEMTETADIAPVDTEPAAVLSAPRRFNG